MKATTQQNLSRIIILVGLLLVISLFGYSTWRKEQILANGDNIWVRLAPVDPRSLMQGDYMVLNYDIPRKLEQEAKQASEGALVYTMDEKGVITLLRLYQAGEALNNHEKSLHYRTRRGRVQLGANSFFFQEGKAKTFAEAKYGELRVDTKGHSILVGLADEQLTRLGFTSGLN